MIGPRHLLLGRARSAPVYCGARKTGHYRSSAWGRHHVPGYAFDAAVQLERPLSD